MQKTMIIGHIGKDAEIKQFENINVINFQVAVTESWKDQNGEKQTKTTWYDCSKWGNNTNVSKYLTKGTQVYVEGISEARAYLTNENEPRAVLGIKVYSIELLGSKNTEG